MPIANRWVPFGLDRDPYFQDALSASGAGPFSAASFFVGRSRELDWLSASMMSGPGTRTVIEGDSGVGKTSFANCLKDRLSARGALTHETPIRIQRRSTVATVVREILRVVAGIRAAVVAAEREAGRSASHEATAGAEWARIAQIAEDELFSGRSTAVADPHDAEVRWALGQLSQDGETPVVIHLEGFDQRGDAEATARRNLMRDLQNVLVIPGGHWLFVGETGVGSECFHAHETLASELNPTVALAPLSPDELAELLERRYARLQRGPFLTPPVEIDAAQSLYPRFHGDLRAFLRLLSTAAEMALPPDGASSMSETLILAAVGAHYRERLTERLGADFMHIVHTMRALRSRGAVEFRAIDISNSVGMARPSAGEAIDRLLTKKVIRHTRTERTSRFYTPTGELSIALGSAV